MRRRIPAIPHGSIQAPMRLLLAAPGGFCAHVLRTIQTQGLTAGASKPEWIVEQEISPLASQGFHKMEQAVVADETISFAPVRRVVEALAPAHAAERAIS